MNTNMNTKMNTKMKTGFNLKKLTLMIFLISIMLMLVSCIKQETIIVPLNTTDSRIIEDNNSAINQTPDTNQTANITETNPSTQANACKIDSDCGSEVIDHGRCWQRSVYTTFNQSKCVVGRCKITQYESITELCDEETQACMAGACVPKPRCFQRGETSLYSYSEVSDGLGNKYGSYCESNTTLVQFFCNPEVPEKIFNQSKACSGGCRNGKCNPEVVVLNEYSNQTN